MNNYRLLFALAALYNAAFALWSGLAPRSFFGSLFGVEPPKTPCVPWPAVACIVGLFGLLYAVAAWKPERAGPLIALGLLTKIVGPIAWVFAAASGDWSVKTFPLVLVGDILWWFPLLSFLVRRSPRRALYIAGVSAVLHLAACVGLLLILPATELGGTPKEKQAWINEHRGIFLAVWMLWTASSLSLMAVVGMWTDRLRRWPEASLAAVAASAVVACGLVLDLCGETSLIVWAARPNLSEVGFASALSWYQRLSPTAANGLYCVGGCLLSLISWRTGLSRGIAASLGFAMWTIGISLTVATFFGSTIAMSVAGGGVMLLYLIWAPLLGWQLARADATTSEA